MTIAYHSSHDSAAKKIIDVVGKTIVIGIPLGIGKPIGFLNALYRLACDDSTIQLTIITGLTLSRPRLHNELEKRFVEPILNRLLKNYEDPLYEKARELQQLPGNIRVIEFFLSPGKFIHNSYVQQNYINSNYTNVVRDLLNFSINVVAEQVAHSSGNLRQYSLSCNSDLILQVAQKMREKKDGKIAIVAEINQNLPFMQGDALIEDLFFTDIIDTKKYPTLFALPHEKISIKDDLIGFYTSTLIKDNGCLQIGIGKLSNAVASALIFRHQENHLYQELCDQLNIMKKFGDSISLHGSLTPFEKGLYASTEMLSDEYMELYKAGILKKRVYDHIGLQRLLNSEKITEKITEDFINILQENHIVHESLTENDRQFLKKFGIVNTSGLGTHLHKGKIMHAGFILGTSMLYQWLNQLSPEELEQINMTSIARTNDLSWSPELLSLQRQHARFVNAAMMVTLSGIVISDGLKDAQEVSGVGGQFDFVNMSQKLFGACSIINCHSVRKNKKNIESNIMWQYPNVTIPRHLRDIIVTEYGIANCRSKTDAEIMKAILNVTDSRFQKRLLQQAKKSGKIEYEYEIPSHFQQNFPDINHLVINRFQTKGYGIPYPFGSDLTEDELVLEKALLYLKECTKLKLFMIIIAALFNFRGDKNYKKYLERMDLIKPKNINEFIYKKLIKYVLM